MSPTLKATATYQLAKYLAKLLAPLSQSQYTVKSTKDFVHKIKYEQVPANHKMVSFDVKSLFTNVHFEETIEIMLRRIYAQHELNTSITWEEMK